MALARRRQNKARRRQTKTPAGLILRGFLVIWQSRKALPRCGKGYSASGFVALEQVICCIGVETV
ncbi:MAG: hypothetical protein P4L87_10430, partial [Formivibrio sp.]|nr:hypothetical protein [Formivibrio sp.]